MFHRSLRGVGVTLRAGGHHCIIPLSGKIRKPQKNLHLLNSLNKCRDVREADNATTFMLSFSKAFCAPDG